MRQTNAACYPVARWFTVTGEASYLEDTSMLTDYSFPTLPDLLQPGMDLVFVGINPSTYSVAQGHYFARRSNRFWPAFSRSRLSEPIRQALAVDALGPDQDVDLLRFGIGFTDVVKVPSSNASQIPADAYREWTPRLLERLGWAGPRLACFQGVMGYRPFLQLGLGIRREPIALGPQPEVVNGIRLYVVPNPSPANAHVTPAGQTEWYDRVAEYLEMVGEYQAPG